MKKMKCLVFLLSGLILLFSFQGCKPNTIDPSSLNIAVVAKGYGSDYIDALIEAYMMINKDINVEVVYSNPGEDIINYSLEQGLDNDIDIYFSTFNNLFYTLVQKDNIVSGYDPVWADLTEIYNTPAKGYKESSEEGAEQPVTYGDLFDPYIHEAVTHTDGKKYAVPYTMGITGLLYQKTLWDNTNDNLPEGEKLELPRTSKEMLDLFAYITDIPKQQRQSAYPLVYCGANDYLSMLFFTWWAQYEGIDAISAALEGKDLTGKYTADIFKSDGREYAYEMIRTMVRNYASKDDASKSFTRAQMDFLLGKGFFNANGDWLEREASENFNPGEADVAFIPIPVISEIVNNPKVSSYFSGTPEEKDAQLCELIDYFDGNVDDLPDFWNGEEDALTFLQNARNINHASQVDNYQITVPAYSKHLDEAKDFIKFTLSKEGQDIMLAYSYGNMFPLRVDHTQFDYYNSGNMTAMAKSKFDLYKNALIVGMNNNHPMRYLAKMQMFPASPTMENAFAVSGTSVKDFMENEYNLNKNDWDNKMNKAYVSND